MKRHRITLLIALCFVMLFGQESVAQTAMERLKAEYPAVMEQYGKRLEAQKADYVIAIDVSGSMLRHRNLVVPALSSFIDAIPDGDYLSIIKFGSRAEEFGLSGKVDASTREGFKQSLSSIYVPDANFINGTNIYAMCEKALDQMDQPSSNDLKYFFIFTDFIDGSGKQESAWQSLGDKVAAMVANKNTVRAFAMQLPGGNGEGRDIPKVRRVFPNLQIIDVENSKQLESWFQGQKAKISEIRLKDLIRGDFEQWYSENKIQLDLVLGLDKNMRLKYKVDDVVPAFVTGFFLDSCGIVKQSSNVEKVTIKTDSSYKGRNISEKIGFLKFFNKWPWQKDVSVTANIAYRPMFVMSEKEDEPSFANEIRKLGLDQELTRSVELPAERAFVVGWNIWLFSICCGLLVAWLWLFIMNTLRGHRLGYLNLLISDERGNVQVNQQLPNKRVVTIGNTNNGNNYNINVSSIASSLVLKGLRGSPLSLIKRRVMAECKCAQTSSDFISIGGTPKKSNKFHRLKLHQNASISSLGVLNFSIGESNAKRSNLKYVIACVLFVLVTLAAIAVCLFL